MPFSEKFLWVVSFSNLDWLIGRAQTAQATSVVIRTDNSFDPAIKKFHDLNIKVYGWRRPSAQLKPALGQAEALVKLMDKGLDGFIADPEGEPGASYDWDQDGLENIADAFCKTITTSHSNRLFGTTSHYRGKKTFKKLPWAQFFKYRTGFFPQSYWRVSDGPVGHGKPDENYRNGISAWKETGAPENQIVPMAGEIDNVTPKEIATYAGAASAAGVKELHFHTTTGSVKREVWEAIAKL
jgi:hypothetical protein